MVILKEIQIDHKLTIDYQQRKKEKKYTFRDGLQKKEKEKKKEQE